ncbi:multidrug MFS transporter [Marinobacterium nitratireducens]|uniref:Multidrug MFS transporter n=1 Tax=Marinobacterium nitratireducens TaxID=518897 RepID=A0A917ZG69_9GAMM|nr:DHA2 family efflux MFS transporter permease subunit [Marinobacterium nitratireducens]GGO81907.1 multidrug MFS transporter [Marinobacterium nitratireducens]
MRTTESLFERHGARYRWLATATVMIGTMSMVLASTIINVAIPSIRQAFDINQVQAQWLVTGFMGAMTLGMLTNAWCVKAFGPRATYIVCMSVFLLASLQGALSPDYNWMVLSRVLQGFMAGFIQPLALVVISEVFPLEQRGRGIGIYGFGVILGPALGPALGGLLVDLLSWRAVFFITIPFGLVGLAMAWPFLRSRSGIEKRPRLDLPGLVLLAATLATLFWGLSIGQWEGWGQSLVWLATSLGLLTGFVLRQLYCREPLLDIRVFRSAGFAGSVLVAVTIGASLFAITYLVPLFVQDVQGRSPSAAGALLMPAGLVMAAVFPFSGRLADRFPAPKLALVGLLLMICGLAPMLGANQETPMFMLMLWLLIGRIGLGVMMPPVTAGSLRLLEPALLTQGTGVVNCARQIGGVLGVNLAALMLELSASSDLLDYTDPQAIVAGFQNAFLMLLLLFLAALYPLWLMHRGTQSVSKSMTAVEVVEPE